MQKINQELEINNNNNLISLKGLENVQLSDEEEMIGIRLEITNNEKLNHCNIRSICDYLNLASTNVEISNNDTSCSDVDLILTNCPTATIANEEEKTLHIFPNPVTKTLYIESTYSGESTIYNSYGSPIETITIIADLQTLTTTYYPRGVYYLKMANGNVISFIKME